MAEVLATRNRMLTFADEVRQTEGITDVVNIGIGGVGFGAFNGDEGIASSRKRMSPVAFCQQCRWSALGIRA